jgi:hypothetical protein
VKLFVIGLIVFASASVMLLSIPTNCYVNSSYECVELGRVLMSVIILGMLLMAIGVTQISSR